MNNQLQLQQIKMSAIIKQKIPLALPLLPRLHINSQFPKSFVQFVQKQQKNVKLTSSQSLNSFNKTVQQIQLPFLKLTDFLNQSQKICFNIIGDEQISIRQATFGFQFFNKEFKTFQTKKILNSATSKSDLQFQSRFESGNLLFAYQQSVNHYILMIRPDYNTMSFCQWFYFKVKNKVSTDKIIKFSIINMTKSSSLFSKGMKILSLNSKEDKWKRSGFNISYRKNQIKRNIIGNYYTLTWEYHIKADQQVYFAYSQPFTYTNLNKCLDQLQNSKYVKRTILCRTLLNNRIDLITVSSGSLENKKVIVIISRTHPAETVGSFVMNGILNFLTSQNIEAIYLREKFIFKLIPMVNPDGVIHGNSRCSMKGLDLNRCWEKPSKTDYEIFNIKKLIMNHSKTDRLLMFCDLHGHSKKKNIFIYGCHDYSQPYASRQFPFIISRIFQPFSYKDCNFVIQKIKTGTARVSLWKKLKIPNIFTLQSSFCSSENSHKHLDEQGYVEMGQKLCKAINIYYSNKFEITKSKINSNIQNKSQQQKIQNQAYKFFNELRTNLLNDLHADAQLLECGLSTPSYSQSQEEKEQVYEQFVKVYRKREEKKKLQEHSKQSDKQMEMITQRSYIPNFFTSKKKSQRYLKKIDFRQISQQKQKSQIQNDSKDLFVNTKKGNLNEYIKQNKNIFDISNNKIDHSIRAKTQTMIDNPTSSNFHEVKIIFENRTKHKNNYSLNRTQHTIEKYVPQIKTFDFQEKFRNTTIQCQIKNKIKINKSKSKEPYSEFYELVNKGAKKQTLMRIIKSKLKTEQIPKNLQSTSSIFQGYRKKNINTRLQTMLKKIRIENC